MELPLNSAEARTRGIGANVSRMNLTAVESDGLAAIACWKAVAQCRPNNLATFVCAIGEFMQLNELQNELGGPTEALTFFPDLAFIQIRPGGDGARVLSTWEAEMLVLFHSSADVAKTIIGDINSLTEKWWKLSNARPEVPFVRQLHQVDPFFFYSSSRSALEFLGSKGAVLRSFDCLRNSFLFM